MSTLLEMSNQFPLSVARGDAFCNRVEQLKRLTQCIQQKRPVLLVSSRRYGKTSLALKAIEAVGLPCAHVDFFSVLDEEDIERLILKGVASLVSQIGSTLQRALALASKVFSGTQVRVSIAGGKIEIDAAKNKQKPAYRILEILEKVELLAKQAQKPVVLFFDEFQSISQATDNHAIEAVLRQVAQLTDSISFIFSGSNRHLLQQLFDDKNRPFYKLCERMTLGRIGEDHYKKHITAIALERWGRELDEDSLAAIFQCTECHPYYVNLLCSRVVLREFPSAESIRQLWSQYRLEERSNVSAELELLSKNQRKLLTVLSRAGGTYSPLGREFLGLANMSKASVDQALLFLEKRDYIYRTSDDQTKVSDPLICSVLCEGF